MSAVPSDRKEALAALALLVESGVDEAIQEIEDEALADDIRDRLSGWLSRHRA